MPPVPTGILQKMITKVGLLENIYREKRYRLKREARFNKDCTTPEMAKRFRSTRRRTRAGSTSRTSRRSKRYQTRATKRMASVQYHTFTLITQMGVTIDINKDYSRVAWTSPNTSGTITPLVALNDSNLFKSMLKTCDAFKIHSVWCTAFVTPSSQNSLKHIVTFSDRTGIEDDLTPDFVNSYGSAKHYILNSNAQSRV